MTAAELAAQFEGLRLRPYLDPAGYWTIGYGAIRNARGAPVMADTPAIDEATALAMLARDIASAEAAVRRLVPVPLTDDQRVALTDFVFNLGAGAFRSSTLRARIRRGDPRAAEEFMRWVYAGGRKLAGLVRRRAAEQGLYEVR
ncbi:MAG: lysozyme [Rhodospirillales bacterium]|nr:lysozyme [Rhodospirillales bacterium]